MFRPLSISALTAALLAAPLAQAYETGDFIIRAGVVTVDPQSSSNEVKLGGTALPGWQVDVSSDTQLGLTATYMLSPELGVGILGATPFKHDIKGDGAALSGAGKLAETKHLPPSITVQYFPLAGTSQWQPYVGAGLNYTNFFEEKTTPTLTAAVGANTTTIELDDSFGVALEAGIDYRISDRIGVNAAIWWADIDTTATIDAFDASGNRVGTAEVDVDIDPFVYMVGLSYHF